MRVGVVSVVCTVCGKKEDVWPSRAKNYLTCSRECIAEYKRSKDMNVKCNNCGKLFHLKPHYIKINKSNSCSRECNIQYRSRIMSGEGNHQFGLKGKDNASWRSDRRISTYGYVLVRLEDENISKNHEDFSLEHKMLMEKTIGRELTKEEVVHHINHIKYDNRLTNLELMSRGNHSAYHLRNRRDTVVGEFFKQILDVQRRVLSWNKIAGNSIEDVSLRDTYWKLVKEEAKELYHAKSDVDILDAILDIGVVGLMCNALHGNTLTSSNKILLSPTNVKSITALVQTLLRCVEKKDILTLIPVWLDLMYELNLQYNIIGAMNEVLDSNDTKFPLKVTVDEDTELRNIIAFGRYEGITSKTVKVNGRDYLVFYAKNDKKEGVEFDKPKIIKPSTFIEPKLLPYIKTIKLQDVIEGTGGFGSTGK